ncbi:MAG: CAP domain-containing protein [Gemmataceae bacterium]
MTRQGCPFRPTLQVLEARTCPTALAAVTPVLSARVLTVQGTDRADVIRVEKVGASLSVAGRTFALSSVDQLVIVGEGGNDTISVSPSLTVWTRIFGNAGNDVILGGGGSDNIYGGPGNDVLQGGAGNDALIGGDGIDALSGGAGSNTVVQGSQGRGRYERNAIEIEVVRLTNLERTRRGLAPLTFNPLLNNAASLHSADMAARGRMSHDLYGTTLPTLETRIDFVGYSASLWAENIAYGYPSARAVLNAWMNSPGHRANILSPALREVGVGVVAGANGALYYTQVFGTQR